MEPELEETPEERVRRMMVENASGRRFSDAIVVAAIVVGILLIIAFSFWYAFHEA